jgi:hypothetical protein
VDASGVSGYLLITEEPTGVFDVWVESESDVLEFLSNYTIEWSKGDAPNPC